MYWALPIYLADRLKYFEELGLDPSFVAYPSGGPQVAAAVESKAWDIGGAGVVPNILAGPSQLKRLGYPTMRALPTRWSRMPMAWPIGPPSLRREHLVTGFR